MVLSRRKAIALIGGGTILAAGGGGLGFGMTRTPAKALVPWTAAGKYADPRKRAVSYALLAPNPHNLQPWVIELKGDHGLSLYQDKTRRLPHTDPYDRQIIIGLGCFLEQMRIAATLDGLTAKIDLFPKGENGPIADVSFEKGAAAEPLAQAILKRRSCKEPFENTPITPEHISNLESYASIITDIDQVKEIRDLTWDAWLVEWSTYATRNESVELMRFGKAEINANPDGIDIGGPFLEGLMLAGLLTRKGQNDPESTDYKTGVEIYQKMLAATPGYAVLTSTGNSRKDQIDAGGRWLRLNLAATLAGVALHPVSQCLQEYPEMKQHYSQAHKILAKPGETVQMLGRLGYGPETSSTPRWPLKAKLRSS